MILGILQARVSSTRLPGKVVRNILGEPMIVRQLERVTRARTMDSLVVATSVDETDDIIGDLCLKRGIPCFRGSLDDVLDRFYRAAEPFKPDHVVRLTGDCPLADPELIDRVVEFHIRGGFDYTGNTVDPTFPDGLDVEVFRFSCLKQAWKEAALPSQREHVTLFMYSNPERFKIGSYKGSADLSRLRWTVDEPRDLEFVTRVYEELYLGNPCFTTGDILALLERNMDLAGINSMYKRNQGLLKSLAEDYISKKV